MKSSAGRAGLTAYEDLFKNDDDRAKERLERIVELPLTELFTPRQHPFRVLDDDAMNEMADSIIKYGVMTPALVRRRREGGYEVVAGNRRKRASEIAGKLTMPVVIRNIDDDAAIILMVDSNMQRETILPSEKAFAYKMKLEAIKRQGVRNDLTSDQVGQKLKGCVSRDLIAKNSPDSSAQIQRYIRLTELLPTLIEMVDNKRIPFNPAVELSYLSVKEQIQLEEIMRIEGVVPSLNQALRLKKLSLEGALDSSKINAMLSNEKTDNTKVILKGETLLKYFPKNFTTIQMQEIIVTLLENWKQHKLDLE